VAGKNSVHVAWVQDHVCG